MNTLSIAAPVPGAGKPRQVQNDAVQRLHFVPLRDYPCLTAPATRIMSESSPMYAMVEDCVPKKQCAPSTSASRSQSYAGMY